MNNFLDNIDKYKFGIVAAFATYIGIFVYVQLPSIEYSYEISPYLLEADMEIPEDEIQLLPENITIDVSVAREVKNTIKDENDTRKKSEKNWSSQKSLNAVEQSVYDLEKEFYKESGGQAEREKIQLEMEKRKKEEEKNAQKNPVNSTTNSKGNDNAYSGATLASFNLKNRTNSALPAPGYLCPQGTSGKVVLRIKVDQNGNVVEAKVDPALSSKLISCMMENAESYAKRARFNSSSSAASIQEGTITFTYVP